MLTSVNVALSVVLVLAGAGCSQGASGTSTGQASPGTSTASGDGGPKRAQTPAAPPASLGAAVSGLSGVRVLDNHLVTGMFERVAVTAKAVLTLQHVERGSRDLELRDPETLAVVQTVSCPPPGGYLVEFVAARDGSAVAIDCNQSPRVVFVVELNPMKVRGRVEGASVAYAMTPDGGGLFGWSEAGGPMSWPRSGSPIPLRAAGKPSEIWGYRRGLISADGSTLLGIRTFHEMGNRLPPNRFDLFDAGGAGTHSFEGTALDSVAFTPDGKYLVRSECRSIVLVDTRTGATAMEVKGETDCDESTAVGPKSNSVFFWDSTLRVLSFASGKSMPVGGFLPREGRLLPELVSGKYLVSVRGWKIGDEEPGWLQSSTLEEQPAPP